MIRGTNGGLAIAQQLKDRHVQAIRERLLHDPDRTMRHPDMGFGIATPEVVEALVDQFKACPLPVLPIVTPETIHYLPRGYEAELLNEPNLGWSPERYAVEVRRGLAIAKDCGVRLWVGSIANLSANDLGWLAKVIDRVPAIENVSVHRYPHDSDLDAVRPKPGFRSREEEFRALRAILGGRAWCVTEFGYHGAPFRKKTGPFWFQKKTARLTHVEQGARIAWDMGLYEHWGAESAYLYQAWDAPVGGVEYDTRLGRYGIVTPEGEWKDEIIERAFPPPPRGAA